MCVDTYVRIVEGMLAQGEKVTLQSVRRAAGRGSFSTIADAIRVVLSRGLIPTEITGPVPESLIGETQRLWQEACKLASTTVVAERLALHSARVESQESLSELTTLADGLAQQVDELVAKVASLQVEKDVAERRAQAAEASLKATKQLLKELGLKPAKSALDKLQGPEEADETVVV